MNNDLKYWVALSTNLNIGARTFQKLNSKFESMEEVWKADKEKFIDYGYDQKIIHNVFLARANADPDEEMRKLIRFNVKAMTVKDKTYPNILKEIADPPALLYIKGEFYPEDELSIAVVGSRKYSPYGEQATEKIVSPLAQAGLTIVSGLALGVDSIAHRTTLNNNGRTIAVLGNGLDTVYPETNRYLAKKILDNNGALISEFPIGTPSFKFNFPFRNRIIAGLSLGVLVIEAAIESGSLITARCALDYNREVFAVPGSIFNEMSQGPNNLIKMGAKTVLGADDILNELNISNRSLHQKAKQIIADTKEEKIVLDILLKGQSNIDKLVEESKIDIIKLNQTMVMMEMKGKIRNLGGNQYVINK